MKRTLLIISLGLLCINIFSETETVSCDGDVFKENSCTVCINGGEANVSNDGISLKEEITLLWKNDSTDLQHIFYKDNMQVREIITNLATIDPEWKGKEITWDPAIVWEDIDVNKAFRIDSGLEEKLFTIKAGTTIPVTKVEEKTPEKLMLKVPVSYAEFSFDNMTSVEKEGAFCVVYEPKVLSAWATETSTTVDEETLPAEMHDATETTPESSTIVIEEPADSAPEIIASYTSDISTQRVSEKNMTYNAASEVPTGPVSNILMLLAISSLICYFITFRAKAF